MPKKCLEMFFPFFCFLRACRKKKKENWNSFFLSQLLDSFFLSFFRTRNKIFGYLQVSLLVLFFFLNFRVYVLDINLLCVISSCSVWHKRSINRKEAKWGREGQFKNKLSKKAREPNSQKKEISKIVIWLFCFFNFLRYRSNYSKRKKYVK